MTKYHTIVARRLPGLIAFAALCSSALAAPVITELMYHPLSSIGSPEDLGKEWIEIQNTDPLNPLDISGWMLTKGVAFTFPSPTVIPAGGHVVVAADLVKFNAEHPGFTGLLRGGWVGSLASGGEQVQLSDALGTAMNDVSYADEGDWGPRAVGPITAGAIVASINTTTEEITTTLAHGILTGQSVSVSTGGTFPASTPSLTGGTANYYVRSVSGTVLKFYATAADANANTNPINFTGTTWTGTFLVGHKGWEWVSEADGGGKTIELRNPALGNGSGQNWAVSAAAGGSPGAANSAASANIAPLIKNAKHKPEIPASTEPIRFSCSIEDEGAGATANLHWRVDGAATFTSMAMADANGDGDLDAVIPAQANLAVIEWYISATDGTNTRTWPAPARTSDIGVLPQTFGQVTNALLQVDNAFSPTHDFTAAGNQPVLRMVLTNAERTELTTLQTTGGQEQSEAAFNATFVSHDGTGTKVVYNSSVKNRGLSSALGPPNNYNLSFRSDDKWNGRSSVQLNCQYGYGQALGNTLFARAGIAPQETIIVQVRVNGADLAEATGRMFGRYAMLEGRGGDWAKRHFPLDPDGNFYRLDDHAPNPDSGVVGSDRASGEFLYEGTTAAAWSDTFVKETNQEANDYSDLANLTRVVSADPAINNPGQPAISDAAYPAQVGTVLDVDQFYRFLAVDALIGNQEGGLQSARADDVSIYRGVLDPRFRFVPHDMDDVFDIGAGVGDPITRSLFSYDEQVQQGNTGLRGLRRMFSHPALMPKYYAAVLDAMNTWFNHTTIDPLIDRMFSPWVPAGSGAASPARTIAAIKAYIDARRANVLAQIPQTYSLTTTGTTADSIEGYKVTTTGAATFAGSFNVAKTYSITVNGVAAQPFYRTVLPVGGGDDAGDWRLVLPAGGGGVLHPGLNKVVVRFWDGINGTGSVLQEFLANVVWNGSAPDSLSLLAPATYVPGVPILVRVDLKNAAGNLNRSAWNTTVNLTATNGVALSPSAITLANGMGSALITLGSSTGGGTVNYFTYGTGGTGTTTVSGVGGSVWKTRTNFTSVTLPAFITSAVTASPATSAADWRNPGFNDTGAEWVTRTTQTGFGDGDENQTFAIVDYDAGAAGVQVAPVTLYRNTFTIADIALLASVTGEIKYDDAYAVYVNGVEISRSTANLAAGAALTAYASVSSTDNMPGPLTIPLANVHTGVNTVAVELHQSANNTTDATFDFRLQGNLLSTTTDPGNFTLTATGGGAVISKALTSLGANPAGTTVSGTLPAGATNWSGVVRVTADLTVPTGATLNIAPGTHVLMTGTSGAGSTTGTDIICTGSGAINAIGTAAQPINITASDATTRWGEVNVGGSTTVWNYCLVSRGCHSPAGGHTGTGPCFRLANGAVWTFEDGVVADLPGKVLTNAGNTTMTMRRSQFARSVMGPETDGSAITIEDSNFSDMLPSYRESGAADDEDCIYIHDSGGRPVNLRRSVFNNCGDDTVDCLAGSLTIEDCVIRNAFDKGLSLLNNDITVRRTQIIDCDIGVSTKCQVGATEATPFLNTFENCTIVCENHPTNTSDGTFHSVGVFTRNKYGTTTMNITMNLRNCIVSAEEPVANDYGAGTFPLNVQNYTCFHDQGGTIPNNPLPSSGTGNIAVVPQFVGTAAKNFNLAAGSPCINTGDPAAIWNDPDGSRNDMGALPSGSATVSTGTIVSANITTPGETHWTLAGSPYHVTTSISVAAGSTLRIDPGVNVQFDQNVRFTINGRILAEGTAANHIVFSHVPGTNLATDVDPIKLLTQTGAPKWGGLRIVDSLALENVVRYCDFINAQGTGVAAPENYGSVGFIRSWGWADHLTFAGTHLRMCYGRNSKITVTYCVFPDMFNFDPLLNRIEEPTTDFIAAADNNMEPLKVEYPTTDPEVSGANAPNYPNGLPLNGLWRCYFNEFHGNRGHQDVFDCDSGRWSPRDASNNQTNGQFVIDCRYNHFNGLAGDEHIDLGGDAYIASNILEHGNKDFWTNDTGYSNAISSGDKGDGTTIMVVRNVCYDLDHVINCKARTATIFEHNTVANMHADFQFNGQTVTQLVVCAPVNFFIPQDGSLPTYGDGAYMGFNLVSNVNHMFSGPDARKTVAGGPVVNDITTKIEFNHNLLDQIADPVIGPNHPGGYFSGNYGPNEAGAPGFVDGTAPVGPGEDFSLRTDSLARATAPGGFSYGASIPEWAYILGGPSGTVASTTASFTVGGPGIVAYKWKLDSGAWSASIQIGDGGLLPRGTPTVRQSTIALSGLTAGAHTLQVLGQDMAGNWQDADPARLYDNLPQATPTTRTWTVDTALPLVMISEVYGDPGQQVELVSRSAGIVDLTNWSLSDNALTPGEQPLSGNLASGALLTVALVNFQLDKDGDALYLFDATNTLRDSVVFGPLPAGYSLARAGAPAAWHLANPTIGNATNTAARMSDSSQIVINEWLAAGGVRYKEDWVELANLAAFPASLTGMILTDARFGTQVAFPALSFIGGNGYVKLIADGNASAGANHTAFKLDSLTEELLLFSATGTAQDNVRVLPQVEGVSQGRVATGGLGGTAYYTLATGGAANGTSDPGYANAVAILNGLRITEIMYNPPGGTNFEFIELTNTGGTTLNLTGVQFYNGIDFTFGNVSLTAGSEVVLVRDLTSFQGRYGNGLNVAGTYTGSLDNNGELIALRLPAPWDANVLCFRYESTWYNANASGYSLQLLSNATSIEDFGDRDSWAAATQFYGTPDSWTPPADPHGGGLASWLTANGFTNADLLLDTDFDGLNNALEFSLNTNPRSATAPNGAERLPTSGASGGFTTITFDLPTTALAGGHGCPGVTYEVKAGTNLTGWTTLAKKTPASATWTDASGGVLPVNTVTLSSGPGGLTRVTVRDNSLISASQRRYMMLSVTVAP